MIQPAFLHAFASTPMRVTARQQASAPAPCTSCDETDKTSATQPVDELVLSAEALAAEEENEALSPESVARAGETEPTKGTAAATSETAEAGRDDETHVNREQPPGDSQSEEAAIVNDLSEEEQRQVSELKARDREVRAHEQAHLAAAGPYATGGPNFTYQEGPDGKRYAVGGEVGIDTAPVSGDAEASIQKAQRIRAAALAPASPSGQDQRVAAAATQMEARARAELAKQNQAQVSATAAYGKSDEANSRGTLLDLVA